MPSIPPISHSLAVREISFLSYPQFKVDKAWQGACRHWSIFGFTRPRVNRSILDARGEHGQEIAFLNFAEKRVTVNLHRMDELGILEYLESIFTHELGHKLCPGDLKTLLLVNSAVCQVIKDENAARVIGNLFRDMIVNLDGFRRGDQGIHAVYSTLWKDAPDPVQQIIGRAYEKLFQRQDTSRSYAQSIVRAALSPELESAADKIAEIILNARRSNWLQSARDFAEALKGHTQQISDGRGDGKVYVISDVNAGDFSLPSNSPIPPKGKADVKQLEQRLGGVVYELRQLESNGHDQQPCTQQTFQQFLQDSKINISPTEASIWYYRDIIGGKVIKVPEVSVSSGALYPFSPKTWQPSDPPQQLDILLTRSLSGIAIPGVTTIKWEYKRGHHLTVGRDYPDLDLWFDSSGSMDNPASRVSHAVTSGMIITKSFLATNKAVRVVNFSGTKDNQPLSESTNGFVRDDNEVDARLVRYLGGNTVLPLDELEKAYATEGRQKYIVMITDLGIQDLTEDKVARLRAIARKAVGLTVFLIGPDTGETQKIFEDIGFEVIPIKDISQLDDQALQLTQKLFEEQIAT